MRADRRNNNIYTDYLRRKPHQEHLIKIIEADLKLLEVLPQQSKKQQASKIVKKNNKKTPKYHLLTATQIESLYKALKGKYIATDITSEQFKLVFDVDVTIMVTPVQWLKETEELVILLGEIYIGNRWQTYLQNKQAFKSREGTIITASTYSTYKSNLSQKEGRTYKEIRTLIESVKQE